MVSFIKELLDPIGFVWFLMLVYSVERLVRREYRPAAKYGVIVVALSFFGGSNFAAWLVSHLESPYYEDAGKIVSAAGAVVVLGGYLSDGTSEVHGFDASESVDRFFAGLEVARSGGVGIIVFGGGVLSGSKSGVSEFSVLRDWLERHEIGDIEVLYLGESDSTREEAERTLSLAKGLSWDRIVLVTSAIHMPRALAVFRAHGLDVEARACNFETRPMPASSVVPNLYKLWLIKSFVHEIIGIAVYKARGWI